MEVSDVPSTSLPRMNGTHLGSESAVQGEGREIQQLLRPIKVDIAIPTCNTYASVNFQLSLICAIDGFHAGVTSLLEGKSRDLQSG